MRFAGKVDCTPLSELPLRALRRVTMAILRAERFHAKQAAVIHGGASMRVVAKQLSRVGAEWGGEGRLNEHFSEEGFCL
jgi:hypothetical protein